MKRVIGLVFLCAAASCIAASAAPPSPKTDPKTAAIRKAVRPRDVKSLAPADEYFGPLKMSIIGIRNMIRDAGLRYDVNHDTARQTYASAQLTERSIRDWEARFPHDDQLPRAVYFLQRLYTKVLSAESRDRARITASWLFADFYNSAQAKQLKKTLVAEHLAPLPSPAPSPGQIPVYGSIFGSAYPSEFNPVAAGPPAAAPSAPIRPTATPARSTPRPASTSRPVAIPRPAASPLRATPKPASPTPAPPRATPESSPTPAAAPTPPASPAPSASPASPTGISVLRGR